MATFDSLSKIVRAARDPVKGKPVENNTRVRLLKGTASDPEVLAVKFHNTDILKFYPDGSIDCIDGWSSSPTTNERIRNWGGIYRYTQTLPTFYRRLPSPDRTTCIRMSGGPTEEHVVCNAVGSYIHFRPDKTIDLDTVRPFELQVIKDHKKLRALQANINALCERIDFNQKLGFRYVSVSAGERYYDTIKDWFMAHAETDPQSVNIVEVPVRGATFTDGILDTKCSQPDAYMLARRYGLLEEVSLKTFVK